MSHYLAPSLVLLRQELNTRWPRRSTISDGWIGDTSHSARVSDHNPDYANGGVVRAIDVTTNGISVNLLLKHTTNDVRVSYVIYNRRIWTRETGYWRAYTGSNPHTSHVHISIRHTRAAETQKFLWFGSAQTPTITTPSGGNTVARRAASANQANAIYVRQREYQNALLKSVDQRATRTQLNQVYVRQRLYHNQVLSALDDIRNLVKG